MLVYPVDLMASISMLWNAIARRNNDVLNAIDEYSLFLTARGKSY